MERRAVVVGLATTLAALAAATPVASARTASLASASSLGPSHGGPAGSPRSYVPLHAAEFAAAKSAAAARSGGGKPGPKPGPAPPTVTTYANVAPSFNGIYQTGGTPPDTTGAAGPDRYIEAINTSYAIYTKSGSQLNSGSLSSLTGISGGIFGYSLSDPQMMWDAQTQRFYYTAVYYDAFLTSMGVAIGWSKTATPASSNDFCKFTVGFGSDLPDYPKLGDSGTFLMVGYNVFSDGASTYTGSEVMTVNKPPSGATCASPSAFAVYFSGTLHNSDGSDASTPVPANLVDDGTGTGYVVANADLTAPGSTGSADFASVYSVTANGTDANGIPVPAVTGPQNVSVPSYSMPANAPQKGSSGVLDTLDGRFEAAVAAVDPANGNAVGLWTAHAVFGGGGAEERWYELGAATGSVLQSGAVSDDALSIWNGAVSPDRANTGASAQFGDSMAMSVSTSSSATYPAIQLVWKKGTDAQGIHAQSPLKPLVQSGGPNVDFSCSPCRWGDYSGASPDPAAATAGRVWLANQYNVAGGSTSSTAWRTWLFAATPAP